MGTSAPIAMSKMDGAVTMVHRFWGDNSYNDGARLSRVPKLASWLRVAMPLDEATLTPQESLDISAFVNSHARPRFVLSEHLLDDAKLGEYNGER